MSELRKDPLSGDWSIIAENRGDRPIEFQQQFERNGDYECPFCSGNEEQTPPAIAQYCGNGKRDDDSPWAVRVVPNKYPALAADESVVQQFEQEIYASDDGLWSSQPALGVNEIIIESSRHVISFGELTDEELLCTMHAFRDAVQRCRNDERTESVSLFKNCRYEAGASIEHTHSQVISLPIVTTHVERQLRNCRDYYNEHGRRLLQTVIEDELENHANVLRKSGRKSTRQLSRRSRIVHQDDDLVTWCPFASRTPFQTRIAFVEPAAEIDQLDDDTAFRVADSLRRTVRALEQTLSYPAYNVLIEIAPLRMKDVDYFQWYIELFPRVTRFAGLELGTSCWINPVSPEQAAERLRAAL